MTKVLMLSVGGSPQPLTTAIEERNWDRILFVVSDGASGSMSSRDMVEGSQIIYTRATDNTPEQRGPGLRNLPATPRDNAITEIPADNLDQALAKIDAALSAELNKGHQVTMDYTGGTKTMTAAMVLAASAHENVALQFMVGKRPDLVQVEAGTEKPIRMPDEMIGLNRTFSATRAFTKQRNYSAARSVISNAKLNLKKMQKSKPPKSWNRRIDSWERWLSMMVAWDKFQHGEAIKIFEAEYKKDVFWAKKFEEDGSATRLRDLSKSEKKPSPVLAEDLWLNAIRRANLGLYDDAVARLYRLSEVAVQSRLLWEHNIDTARVDQGQLTKKEQERAEKRTDYKGEFYFILPLMRALEVLSRLSPNDGIVTNWPRKDNGEFVTPKWQSDRNRSILAHGFFPLGKKEWEESKKWFEERQGALWKDCLGRTTACQLPDRLPRFS